MPWPIKVTGAKARFDGSELIVQGLAGTVGQSGFSQCSGQITLAAESRLQVSSCEADAELVELFDWASQQFELPDPAKGLRVVAGRGLVQIHTIAGALAEPAKWSGDVSVPVGMRGKVSDPQIVPVAPSAVAGSLLGVLERFLKTPFNLREALMPPAMQSGDGAASPGPAPRSNSGPKQ